jgi:hypothetical protein
MASEAAPSMVVLVKAVPLAQISGASEIGIDHLLAALAPQTSSVAPAAPVGGPFFPVPKCDMALSTGALAAMASLGEISTIPADVLRRALLAAKRHGAH